MKNISSTFQDKIEELENTVNSKIEEIQELEEDIRLKEEEIFFLHQKVIDLQKKLDTNKIENVENSIIEIISDEKKIDKDQ